MRVENFDAIAKRIKDAIVGYEVQLATLKRQNPLNDDDIREVEADLGASRRILLQLENSKNIDNLQKEIDLIQVVPLNP